MKNAVVIAGAVFALCATNVLAQDEAPAAPAAPKKAQVQAAFSTLPFCRFAEGPAEVLIPSGEWKGAEEGKFYPLGSCFRTRGAGELALSFGPNAEARISGEASFGTLAQPLGVKSRTIVLGSGTLDLVLADNLTEGALFVTAPGFKVKNPAGESRYHYEKTSFGDRATIRCVTGTLGVEGRHFNIPEMGVADELLITGEHDHLVTVLENTSGDYKIRLDQGSRGKLVIAEDGSKTEEVSSDKAEIRLTPKMKVNIHRALPSVGERMSVFVIAFDAAGAPIGPGVSFCEGRAEITSGELVTPQETASENQVKKTAEADVTTEAAAEEEAPAEAASSEADSSEKTEE